MHFSGGLHVDGKIKGRVLAEDGSDAVIRLSEIGEITGDITAPHVIINGKVNGDVRASSHLELAENAAINGSVYYRLIEMAMGASVNGNLVREDDASGLLTHDKPSGLAENQTSEDEGKSE